MDEVATANSARESARTLEEKTMMFACIKKRNKAGKIIEEK
jgi:hypothetical protein